MDSKEQELPIPLQIGRYKIEGLLTQGGMSLLYLGTHPDTAETVLIKVLLPKFVQDQEIQTRFLNEAHIIAKTNHPNIVKLYDSGTWDGGLYIAMEFVKGSSLRKILMHQPFSLKRALEILLQIAYALCHLHTHGIVHGDLKPENILITETGQVKLIDFGIAQTLNEKRPIHPPKRLAGTPVYMSPEQLENWGNVSCQSDIYALGILAYELAMGKITHGRVIISLAPKGLQKLLHKALQPNIEDRYSDVVDFISDLSTYIKSGSYKQDKQGSDYFLELFETLEKFQVSIIKETPFDNTPLEIGLVARSGMGISCQYYECQEMADGKQVLFIAESPVKGVEGALAIAAMRVLFLTVFDLLKNKPVQEIILELSKRVESDPFIKSVQFSCLVIDTGAQQLQFFHKKLGCLLKNGVCLPLHPIDSSLLTCTADFKKEDILLFTGCVIPVAQFQPLLQNAYKDTFDSTHLLPCQSISEAIIRRLHLKDMSAFEEEPLILITIRYVKLF